MKTTKQSKQLKESSFIRLFSIFNQNNWPLSDMFGDSYFEDFCSTLSILDDEECKMVLDLTEKFVWINEQDYLKIFINVFNSFTQAILEKDSRIVISPLLAERDYFSAKSSSSLYYSVWAVIDRLQKHSKVKSISCCDHPKKLLNIDIDNKTVLCLIDDFIGSGETAISAVEYLEKEGIKKDNIVVLSIAAMEAGICALQEKGIRAFSDSVFHKGITGTENETEWTRLMTEIERRINVKEAYCFGYKRSEALVRMARTPNNTFPIYWLKNKVNKTPPFVRS